MIVDGTRRSDIRRGLRVSIVVKKGQRTGKLTEGIEAYQRKREDNLQPPLLKAPTFGWQREGRRDFSN
jgi:hypothetical protein